MRWKKGGAPQAGDWTVADNQRLRVHSSIMPIRRGMGCALLCTGWVCSRRGPGPGNERYNFGSRESVIKRWKAAINAGVEAL